MGGKQSSPASVNGDAKAFIEKTVSEHPVVLFSKSTCPYCVRVKKLFGDVRADIFLVEINKRSDMSALQDELNRITGARTVPRVFIGGECIGGCDETVALYERGKLVPRLKELGAINF